MTGYVIGILLAIDRLVNTVLGGNPLETISSRVGRNAIKGNRFAVICEKIIDTLFFWRPNHCRNAIEWWLLSPPEDMLMGN